MKKLFIGLLVSIVFIYFSFRGVDFGKALEGLRNVQYVFLVPAVVLLLLISWLRSLRWGVILSATEQIPQRKLFPITCVGFMAIALFPMRIGELARPYLVSREGGISFSPALATIFIERVIDSLSLLVILLLVMVNAPLPAWMTKTGYGLLAAFSFVLLFVCLLYFSKGLPLKLLGPFLRRLPPSLRERAEHMVGSFADGFAVMGKPGHMGYIFLLSLLIWGASGIIIYSLFFFLNLALPVTSAFVVLIVTIAGISLPTAPGLIGNFQFACIVGLSLFGVPKDNALAFSMVYYLIGIGIQIVLGLLFLPSLRISFRELGKMGFTTRHSGQKSG
ncbi:MAG: flippase-like domain-containing protein [Alphaproteobacteria bacterium]|uniref:Flippase-like domain-containing protein n=1 Tax=Candidatus Nitrobium versatile TaxID=2884831 RepID=A0A953JFR5_9BACT|nr:flippase-like domain-containing protein [Candidatus Nitrobium versatile]